MAKPPTYPPLSEVTGSTPYYHQYTGDQQYQSTADQLADYVIRKGGADKHFEYERLAPSTSWTIPHNLNKRPSVQIIDSDGDQVFADVTHIDENTLIIQFSSPTAGIATLN